MWLLGQIISAVFIIIYIIMLPYAVYQLVNAIYSKRKSKKKKNS